LIKKKKRT